MSCQCPFDQERQVCAIQLSTGHVDRNTQIMSTVAPLAYLSRRPVKSPKANFRRQIGRFHDRNKAGRRDQSSRGMVPTEQCLCPRHPPCRRVYQRLKLHAQFVPSDSLTQILFYLEALARLDRRIDARYDFPHVGDQWNRE